MSRSLVALGTYCAILGALLAYCNLMQIGFTVFITTAIVVLLIGYTLVFAGFCFMGRTLVRSPLEAPIAAIKLQLNICNTVIRYVGRGFKPHFPQWTLTFEITRSIMRYMFEEFGEVIAFENAHLLREPFAMHGRMILKSNCRKHNTIPEKLEANGLEHMWFRDPDKKQYRVVVIHFHGGGFAMSHPLQDVELANQTHTMLQQMLKDNYQLDISVDVLLANYRKSPENPYPTPDDDCLKIYQFVLKHENVSPKHIIFSGDSAGAKLSLFNCIRMRDSNPEQLPLCCLLYSPSVDFEEKGGDEKSPFCIMPAKFVDSVHQTYLAKVTDPEERLKVSPVNRDLRNLPPMFVQYGTLERFYHQGKRIIAKAKEQGVTNWEVDFLENMPHDVVMLPTDPGREQFSCPAGQSDVVADLADINCMTGSLLDFGLHFALLGVFLAYFDVLHFGFQLAVPIIFLTIVLVYALLFAGFCYAAYPFATSFVLVPYIAIKMQVKLISLLAAYVARGFKPTFPEWTLVYEITIAMMRYTFLDYGHIVADVNAHRLRPPFEMHGKFVLKSNSHKHGTVPEKLVANGMEHMWLRDPVKKQHRVVVIHYHGGGYCISDPLQDVELANQTHTKLQQILKEKYQLDASIDVLLANYRMAPQFLYPTALNDCFDIYQYVLKHENISPDHVVFSGDSAGAEMSMTNCMRLRKESPELQPVAALCYSPVVDFSETDNDEKTPYCILAANFADNCLATYLRDVTDPEERRLVSPINHSLKDLPPIFLQWGTLERFYEQGLRFKAKADAEGVTNMELDILENIVHDPVMFPTAVSPAAEKGIHHGCEFAARYLAPVLRASSDPEPEPRI
ncbi:hypothetical protein BBO99_00002086 [Phytophthora kernoviae]|uniref:Alpha/beta hydrolase fold-3 domain-containing protein n=2 Tax=Phytophthora kernoviae TaxID=325452 RepID=A0A3R7K1S9_9STRA|nr:hypothetical protein G195_003496 [Phytophthora kernoviae 00238/432]RLN45483.1 hypothetical protein BBI17_001909 [Phytophthora kernoviae]RLN83534.1 hypothetical protein BBO99_00002086 [Phytophthora kernoviae]